MCGVFIIYLLDVIFHSGGPIDMQGPPTDVGPGRPMLPRFDGPSEHPRIPGPMMWSDSPRFTANEPEIRRRNEDFRGPPMEHDHNSHG